MDRDGTADGGAARLSEQDVRSVLERASHIEASGDGPGLTVSELHEIAHQVGIPSEALSRALREVARTSTAGDMGRSGWLHHREISFVAGHLSDEDLAWLIRLLDQLGQIQGTVRYEQGALRWRSPAGYHLEIVNRPHETHLSVEAHDYYPAAKAAFGFVGLGALIGVIGVDAVDALFPIAVGAAAGAVGFGLYWKLRVERLRNAIGKVSKGVSEVLRMVIRRGDEAE